MYNPSLIKHSNGYQLLLPALYAEFTDLSNYISRIGEIYVERESGNIISVVSIPA